MELRSLGKGGRQGAGPKKGEGKACVSAILSSYSEMSVSQMLRVQTRSKAFAIDLDEIAIARHAESSLKSPRSSRIAFFEVHAGLSAC